MGLHYNHVILANLDLFSANLQLKSPEIGDVWEMDTLVRLLQTFGSRCEQGS
jgi:hypothetical protein